MRKMISKRRIDQIVMSSVMTRMVGMMCGRVTARNDWKRVAPSTQVASRSSCGTLCRALSITSMTSGVSFQTVASVTAKSPYCGSTSQPCSPSPSALVVRFRMPCSLL